MPNRTPPDLIKIYGQSRAVEYLEWLVLDSDKSSEVTVGEVGEAVLIVHFAGGDYVALTGLHAVGFRLSAPSQAEHTAEENKR